LAPLTRSGRTALSAGHSCPYAAHTAEILARVDEVMVADAAQHGALVEPSDVSLVGRLDLTSRIP